jgi:hypothetical protein
MRSDRLLDDAAKVDVLKFHDQPIARLGSKNDVPGI